jgi:endoglucanase
MMRFPGLLICAALAGCLLPSSATETLNAGAPGPGSRNNLLPNGTFEGGRSLPWTSSFTVPADGNAQVVDGALCLVVEKAGTNRWDAQIRHREMIIQRGHTYSVRFTAHASRPTKIRVKVGQQGPPYNEYWFNTIDLTEKPRVVSGSFVMENDDDPTAELALHIGGELAASTPFRVCIDDVVLSDPEFVRSREVEVDPIRKVLVNQVGYLPHARKVATVKSSAPAPLPWRLHSSSGDVVASGSTIVHGHDAASGEDVHEVDFSSFNTPGKGYTLEVDKEVSHSFEIDARIYQKLKYDALAFFYHNRSGIEIAMPWASRAEWTRPAGHPGDRGVPCAPGSGCSYTLDVSGGWYDAGDHGKYVVNGGIAVWTLLNQYERARYLGASIADLGDGKLNIPERQNGVPDLLDEARWEMEFLLKMQVPAGQPLAGMAHHKIHDQDWTALAVAPHQDKMKRFLYSPSTAATLNLAATAAQCARIWKTIDTAFSARCLTAAERAWAAAQAHPALLAPTGGVGGGPYDDRQLSDEAYWAACELFITTKNPAYQEYLAHSPHYKTLPPLLHGGIDEGLHTAMTWQSTQALGSISLAVVPSSLPAAEVAEIRSSLGRAADLFVQTIESQGYGVAMAPSARGEYPWGSNSNILNNLIVVALAYDFTKNPRYLNAVAQGMDYLLGRNPLDQSYVTGYGARPIKNPHHRFWAHQADARFPSAPPGVVSGGPNTGFQDPYIQGAGLKGCAPLKCFIDHIESWSSNEVTINWNAPLAWVAAFLDEHQ